LFIGFPAICLYCLWASLRIPSMGYGLIVGSLMMDALTNAMLLAAFVIQLRESAKRTKLIMDRVSKPRLMEPSVKVSSIPPPVVGNMAEAPAPPTFPYTMAAVVVSDPASRHSSVLGSVQPVSCA
jgi:hypothetical protein